MNGHTHIIILHPFWLLLFHEKFIFSNKKNGDRQMPIFDVVPVGL